MFVFSNLATSLDGKIATIDHNHYYFGTPKDREQMQNLRAQCDAILMGSTSMRVFKRPCLSHKRKGGHAMNVVLSRSLEGISPKWLFFKDERIRRVLFITEAIPAKRLLEFQAHSTVIRLRKDSPHSPLATQMIRYLERLGVRRLLVEGGGEVMWHFASRNLIDEYNVTLTPKIVGGRDAPTLVEGKGFRNKDILNLKLKSAKILGNEIFLVYEKTRKRG